MKLLEGLGAKAVAALVFCSAVDAFYIPGKRLLALTSRPRRRLEDSPNSGARRLVNKELPRRGADPAAREQSVLGQHAAPVCLLRSTLRMPSDGPAAIRRTSQRPEYLAQSRRSPARGPGQDVGH